MNRKESCKWLFFDIIFASINYKKEENGTKKWLVCLLAKIDEVSFKTR